MLELGHHVKVAAPVGSLFPKNATGIETVQLPFQQDRDDTAYQNYSAKIRNVDVVHDFSHGHVYAKRHMDAPTLNVIWDNLTVKYSKAPLNIVALSRWQKTAFESLYKQQARLIPTVCANENRYHPIEKSNDRFLIIGKMSPDKGIVEALKYCRKLDAGADVVGSTLPNDDQAYKYEVMRICDGEQFIYWGEVNDDVKIHLLQNARAVLNARTVPEAFWHVGIEAMLCGTPIIAFNHSSYQEIVQHDISGYLCEDETTFLNAMKQIESLNRRSIREYAMRFARSKIVSDYLPVYKAIADGEVWC